MFLPINEVLEMIWVIDSQLLRGLAPETQLSMININVMMTPRSGVSVDDDEVDGVGDKWTTAFGSIVIRTANLLWAPTDVR
ncbi:hypothetical protein NDA12_002483 [Ustilago hordei]|nr:hypothetical protein NDA15_007317 [Ustilago hordei]KAJ1589958.1 hypothetical protein NDA12_002483 [Ustilago hordei]